jgi:hypothetical protein
MNGLLVLSCRHVFDTSREGAKYYWKSDPRSGCNHIKDIEEAYPSIFKTLWLALDFNERHGSEQSGPDEK